MNSCLPSQNMTDSDCDDQTSDSTLCEMRSSKTADLVLAVVSVVQWNFESRWGPSLNFVKSLPFFVHASSLVVATDQKFASAFCCSAATCSGQTALNQHRLRPIPLLASTASGQIDLFRPDLFRSMPLWAKRGGPEG